MICGFVKRAVIVSTLVTNDVVTTLRLSLWCMGGGLMTAVITLVPLAAIPFMRGTMMATCKSFPTAPTAEQEWMVNDMGVGQTLPKGYSPIPEWEIPSFETEDWKEE